MDHIKVPKVEAVKLLDSKFETYYRFSITQF